MSADTVFEFTGAVQTYVVPPGYTSLPIACKGAPGGDIYGGYAGAGGYAAGDLAVTPGETLYIYVGGRPTDYVSTSPAYTALTAIGGWNGGGNGYYIPYASLVSGGGGGASDVRQGGTALTNRKIVAAGGGGGSRTYSTKGGAGGGTTGAAGDGGVHGGGGGTQSAGGTAGTTDGYAGLLGLGGRTQSQGTGNGGGGGGGYYGGGGGGESYAGGGGGGSSYIGGVTDGSTTAGTSYAAQVIISLPNMAPNAPTLVAPTSGATIACDSAQTFTWTFSDPNDGDTQSAAELRYRALGAGSWTTLSVTTPAGQMVVTAGTFADATAYEWQVRTADALGLWGPYSASALFSAVATPGAPSIIGPANNATLAVTPYTVTWSTANQDAYQLRSVADITGIPDPSTVYTDTGTVEEPATRTADVTFAANRNEHLQVRVRYDSLWSPWASVHITVALTPPMTPTVVVATSDAGGYIALTPTQPTPTGGAPTVVWVDVYRREAGAAAIRIAKEQPPATTYLDYQVASGVDYTYIVRAVSSTSTTADSNETA